MNYLWEHKKPRRVMHIQRHTVTGKPLFAALCGIRLRFNRAINAPFALGRRVCKKCKAVVVECGSGRTTHKHGGMQ